jgi:hypothetical protein
MPRTRDEEEDREDEDNNVANLNTTFEVEELDYHISQTIEEPTPETFNFPPSEMENSEPDGQNLFIYLQFNNSEVDSIHRGFQ